MLELHDTLAMTLIYAIPVALLLFVALAWARSYRGGFVIFGLLAIPLATQIAMEQAILASGNYQNLPKGFGLGFVFTGGLYLAALVCAIIVACVLYLWRGGR